MEVAPLEQWGGVTEPHPYCPEHADCFSDVRKTHVQERCVVHDPEHYSPCVTTRLEAERGAQTAE
eukprot:CAMPEP_0179962398 /NCGR_PEP_ID=MMETSP0983-20121128/30206_1 /TAXON_ID=483367 /ORGANISM="non described non described, Strain CCMP 2436" /LENGTH=64 /DNA_ID=CAMNT_0021874919 /DNA_START=387 /DNA_END=581 /DNA_ORIENTATION=-